MKRYLFVLALFLTGIAQAGTISRTNYTAGNSVTAALQNSNENTVVNEVNGNLDNDNIKAAAGISMSKLATQSANQLVVTDASGVLTSTAGPTVTEIGYTSGLTSNAQTQITNLTNSLSQTTFVGLGRNRILNGDMRVDQNKEGGSYTSGAGGAAGAAVYSLDQWRFEGTGVSTFTVKRTNESLPNGRFNQAMKITITSSGTIGHADGANMEYPMEPIYQQDWAWGSTNASSVTLSFWVLSSSAGIYSVSFLNGVNTRSYVSYYTVTTANVWQHQSITVPGDTANDASVWPTSGTVFGLKIVWDIGSGSDVRTTSLNQWITGSKWRASNADSFQNTVGALYLTGVQIEIGSTATAFEYMPYDMQLRALQRYYYKTFEQGTAVATAVPALGGVCYITSLAGIKASGTYLRFPVPMLATPTMTAYSTGNSSAKWWNDNQDLNSGDVVFSVTSQSGALLVNSQVAGDAAEQLIDVHVTANSRLGGS